MVYIFRVAVVELLLSLKSLPVDKDSRDDSSHIA